MKNGKNSQPVTVQLDTGSKELWVDPDCSTASTAADQAYCNGLPRYNPETSSTHKNLKNPFFITYGKGNVSGTYYTDDLKCGSATIKSQQFGVANTSNDLPFGIMG